MNNVRLGHTEVESVIFVSASFRCENKDEGEAPTRGSASDNEINLWVSMREVHSEPSGDVIRQFQHTESAVCRCRRKLYNTI